jgi:hypothetical protein
MKPLHIGLLILGAALAGGVAVTMTQPPAIPVLAPVIQPPAPPAAVRAPSAAANAPVPKPSPIPVAPRIALAAAPEPVYNEPTKPAIRKNKPKPILSVPVLLTKVKPTQWSPAGYVPSAEPRSSTPPAPTAPTVATGQDALPEPPPTPAPIPKPTPAPTPKPRQVTLETGMTIAVRLDESVSRTAAGDSFQASLVEPLVVDGLAIAERGARVTGRVRVNSLLELGLATLSTSDGQRVAISTDPWKYGEGGAIAGGTVIRFRLTSRSTITEQRIAGR